MQQRNQFFSVIQHKYFMDMCELVLVSFAIAIVRQIKTAHCCCPWYVYGCSREKAVTRAEKLGIPRFAEILEIRECSNHVTNTAENY